MMIELEIEMEIDQKEEMKIDDHFLLDFCLDEQFHNFSQKRMNLSNLNERMLALLIKKK